VICKKTGMMVSVPLRSVVISRTGEEHAKCVVLQTGGVFIIDMLFYRWRANTLLPVTDSSGLRPSEWRR